MDDQTDRQTDRQTDVDALKVHRDELARVDMGEGRCARVALGVLGEGVM